MKLRSCLVFFGAGVGAALQFQACHVDYAVDEDFFSHTAGSGGETNGAAAEAGAGDTTGNAGTSTGPGASSNNGGDNGAGATGATGAVDSSGGTSDTGGSGGTSVVLPSCGDGEASCLEPAPANWLGPFGVALGAATGSPSCTGSGYESQVFSLSGELDEGTATCDCECGSPSGMTCGSTVSVDRGANSTVCVSMFNADYTLTTNGSSCQTETYNGYHNVSRPAWAASGGCTGNPTVDIDTAHWASKALACETNALAAECTDSQLCLPNLKAPLDTWCIYREGAYDCPAGAYSVQSSYYEDFSDGRDCTTCTCGSATGQCDGYITYTSSCSGGATYMGDVAFGNCADLDIPTSWGATASVGTPAGSCTPIGGELTGEIEYTGEITMCCLP